MLKIQKFAKEKFGVILTDHQLQLIAIIAASPDDAEAFVYSPKQSGKTMAVKVATAYLQDGLSDE